MAIQVEDDAFEVGFIDNFFVFGGAEEQGGAADIVDVTGGAFGMFKQVGDETAAEKLALKTGDTEMVFDVSGGLFEIEGGELVADSDALLEGMVRSKGQFLSEVRLAEEDEGEVGSGVEIGIEQKAELVKDFGREEMGLVNDEQQEAVFAGEVEESVVELGLEVAKGKGGFDFESAQDVGVEGSGFELGIGQVSQGIEIAVEGVGKGAQGGRFTGADIASDEGR